VHTQYNLFYQAEVFTTGLLLGYLRHRNGSTLLTVAIHAAINIASAMELAWFLA
jgi:hypothetical protein